MGDLMGYLIRIAIALDQLLNVLLCNGEPDETMSSAAWRMEQGGYFWGCLRPIIDSLFWFQEDHCRKAYEAEVLRLQYSKKFRNL